MQRLEREMARRRDLIERLSAVADVRFFVMVEGPVRAQVPLAQALDHVPTETLVHLLDSIRSSAAQDLFTIARLRPSQLAAWRPGDVLKPVRDLDQVGKVGLIDFREYGIERLLSQPEDGSAASVVGSAEGEGSPDGKVAQVTDGDLEVGGSPGHDGLSFVSGAPSIQPGLGR